MQLEQNLANAIADAATVNYDQQFQISSQYLEQMSKLQSEMASAAQKASQTSISASNAQQPKSVQQKELLEQVWRSAWQNAKNAGASRRPAGRQRRGCPVCGGGRGQQAVHQGRSQRLARADRDEPHLTAVSKHNGKAARAI